jgi:hypothetical protein
MALPHREMVVPRGGATLWLGGPKGLPSKKKKKKIKKKIKKNIIFTPII